MKNEDEAASLQTTVSELLKQLQKKQTFESAASALSTLIQDHYAEAAPAQQNSVLFLFLFYICFHNLLKIHNDYQRMSGAFIGTHSR